ncbi:store-operated calcium entry-associated regulatory factor isoform X2 [Dermacentor silvarum]|uniref:store-operated calcium entry-associated regulatory factor isoform X2 n=1 Tax=Dermacentor silvarum TaxID=543639 RepID=UPI002101CF3B|nr:store-operated calcium entry-associated regulatory factor isoform X2 [Dermacentor silvarum]
MSAALPSPFKMRHAVAIGALLFLFARPSDSLSGDKVMLKDVQVLTLRQGQYTTGRRSHPVPQLNCRGGSAGCQDQPAVVQCYNRGSDGRDAQWECKAEMKKTQKFGLIQVTCEGYDYPKDEYVLVGSCGLEYYLERTEHGGGSSGQHRHNGYPRYTSAFSSFSNAIFFVLVALGACVFCLCCVALCAEDTRGHLQWRSAHSAGYRPFIIRQRAVPSAPPPDYGLYDAPPSYSASQYPYTNYGCARGFRPASTSEGPGFWTGAATGGLLGYLYGNRGCDRGERTVHAAPIERTFEPASSLGNSSSNEEYTATDVSSVLSDVITSTGFGGTDRR